MYFAPREVDAFWNSLRPHWNRTPALIKRPFSKPFVTHDEFLRFLRHWGDEARGGKRAVDVQLIDLDVLPRADDQTFASLEERIAERWARDWYLYIPDGIQQYDGDVWERAIELTRPAIRLQGGLPSGGMMLDLFYGKYASTPSGIHLDSSDNLAFIVRGPKRMVFWAPDRFTVKFGNHPLAPSHQQSHTGRYRDYLADAIVFDADEGDVVYWPKEYWHIGVSADRWSGMVSLPMWWSASPTKLAGAILPRVLDLRGESQLYPMDPDDLASAASNLPQALGDMVAQIRAQVNAKLDLTARVGWAKFVTAYGFTTPPSPRLAPAVDATTRVRVKHPIVSVPIGPSVAIVACGQHTLTPFGRVRSAVEELRVGSEHTVADLVSAVPAPQSEAEEPVAKMVGDLFSFRALDLVDARGY